jgi:ribonuclease HII
MADLVRVTVPKRPSIRLEKEFSRQHGGAWVAGVDEAGRGPLAGPVVAAAVILPFDGRRPVGLRDSKQLTARAREKLFGQIQRLAVSYGIGIATAQEIDLINILEATRLAARRALEQLNPAPAVLVTDALLLPKDDRPQLPVIKGDAVCMSISAASILAKVTRDRLMDAYAEEFPEFNWTANRGYPTPDHYEALATHGPTILHRLTFNGVGFFACEPHRSPTFLKLRPLIEGAGTGAENSLESLRALVESSARRLPPPDLAELRQLIQQRSSQGV